MFGAVLTAPLLNTFARFAEQRVSLREREHEYSEYEHGE